MIDKKSKKKLVSIIIPVFNSADFLRVTLDWLIELILLDIEIILVDDGSNDDSRKIIHEYSKLYPQNIFYLYQTRRGASSARNLGFNFSKGQFIQFLDADDLLPREKLEAQIEILNAHPQSIVGCSWIRFKENPQNLLGEVRPGPNIPYKSKPLDWLTSNRTMIPHCWLIPRHIVEVAGPWDVTLAVNQDGEFMNRVIANSKEVIFDSANLVYYRVDNIGSVSKVRFSNFHQKMKSFAKTMKSFERVAFSLVDSDKSEEKVMKELARIYFFHYPVSKIYFAHFKKYTRINGGKKREYSPETPWEGRLMPYLGWRLIKLLKFTIWVLKMIWLDFKYFYSYAKNLA